MIKSIACVDAEANKFINFLNEYWLIFGALFLGFGCYITFIGWKKWRINFQVIVAVPTFFISTLNIFGLFSFSTPEIVLWIALLVCAGGSYYVGRYAYQNLKIGFYMIGSYMGIIIGLLLYQSVFANLHYFNLLVIGLMITILAVLGGVLGLRYWQ